MPTTTATTTNEKPMPRKSIQPLTASDTRKKRRFALKGNDQHQTIANKIKTTLNAIYK